MVAVSASLWSMSSGMARMTEGLMSETLHCSALLGMRHRVAAALFGMRHGAAAALDHMDSVAVVVDGWSLFFSSPSCVARDCRLGIQNRVAAVWASLAPSSFKHFLRPTQLILLLNNAFAASSRIAGLHVRHAHDSIRHAHDSLRHAHDSPRHAHDGAQTHHLLVFIPNEQTQSQTHHRFLLSTAAGCECPDSTKYTGHFSYSASAA